MKNFQIIVKFVINVTLNGKTSIIPILKNIIRQAKQIFYISFSITFC